MSAYIKKLDSCEFNTG